MKPILIAIGLIAMSSAAFADGRPTVQGNKCWAISDSRGFGYWDNCASGAELAEKNREQGYKDDIPRARTQPDIDSTGGAGGGGGGGGE